jgi:DNA-binding MarR family transcriptional regulator
VFDLVKTAGAIPLDELTALSTNSPENVEAEVQDLARKGLVEVEQSPETEAADVVKLTTEGYRVALR